MPSRLFGVELTYVFNFFRAPQSAPFLIWLIMDSGELS